MRKYMRKSCVTQRKSFYLQLDAPVIVPNVAILTTQQNIENVFSIQFLFFSFSETEAKNANHNVPFYYRGKQTGSQTITN